MRSKVTTFEQAAARVPDDATVAICGAWMQVPDRMLAEIGRRFAQSGHPRNLTAVFPICPGGVADQPGIEHLARAGLLKATIAGSYPNASGSELRRLIHDDVIDAYNFPSGLVTHWLREIGAGRPGALSRTGLGTFVDPRIGGGSMNRRTPPDRLSVVDIAGSEHIFLPSSPVHVAIIRGSTADEAGNLTTEQESAAAAIFVQASAARASGGLVIAQVRRVAPAGSLNPHHVRVPGTLVDCVVVDPDQKQASAIGYNPALSGESRAPLVPDLEIPAIEQQIARRAAQEIRSGDVVVLGYGMSAYVPHVMLQDGRFDDATFAIEHGAVGGLPLPGFGFGNSLNSEAIVEVGAQFDLLQGGCFDRALLSFLQVDAAGRVNVHLLNARPHLSVGIGGFLDIAAAARRLVFLGYFTAGGLEVATEDGRLRIVREGKARKFVRSLDNVSFDPAYGAARDIVFITERAVLRWCSGKIKVEEVTPGIDFQREILDQMEFAPES